MGSCLTVDGRSSLPYSPTSPLGVKRQRSSNPRRRQGMPNSSFDDQLRSVPGRMFWNGSSDVASLFTQQGRKGTNQDAMLFVNAFRQYQLVVGCALLFIKA